MINSAFDKNDSSAIQIYEGFPIVWSGYSSVVQAPFFYHSSLFSWYIYLHALVHASSSASHPFPLCSHHMPKSFSSRAIGYRKREGKKGFGWVSRFLSLIAFVHFQLHSNQQSTMPHAIHWWAYEVMHAFYITFSGCTQVGCYHASILCEIIFFGKLTFISPSFLSNSNWKQLQF